MRKLASVVTIKTKQKMFEKDKICVVTFEELGYEAIVSNDVSIGDRMIFIQEGSILPETSRWEYLRKRCYNSSVKGFVIKPMTMGAKDLDGQKGDRVKSWGLCVSFEDAGFKKSLKSDTDVTKKLKIRKLEDEDEESLKTTNKFLKFFYKLFHKKTSSYNKFPSEIISKSDETTIQNCASVIQQFKNTRAFITAKMEGQSFTCGLDTKKNDFFLCSRNNKLINANDGKVFFDTAERYDIENKLKQYYKDTGELLVIQGEQCGPSIQHNIYNFEETRWFVFRIKKYINKQWTAVSEFEEMKRITNALGLETVPLIEVVDNMSEKFKDVDSLVKYAENIFWKPNTLLYTPKSNEKLWKHYFQHEGIVIKSDNYDKERDLGFSFKVKNMSYQEHELSAIHSLAEVIKNS